MDTVNAPSDRTLCLRALAVVALVTLIAPVAPAQSRDASAPLAKIAAVQNDVASRRADAATWGKASRDEALYGRDRVRTGAASRAAIRYADDTLHRLDEKSEVEIVPPAADSPGLLKVLTGRHYFASRRPKDFGRVETPTVTAAIKGTEFAVDVAEGGTTTITMIEGVVVASNEFGTVEVGAGERAVAEPGKAPVRSVVVRPRDAVAWALYYPPVVGGADADRLRGMGDDGASLARAAELLGTGQVEQAKSAIAAVLARRPAEPVALSLSSVMALVEDRKDEARRLAERAVAADDRSAAAALAASFVAQADFEIAKAAALAERAAELDPNDPTALARAAELRMAQGDLAGARSAAEGALSRAPRDARALSVLGFVELAQLQSVEAASRFEAAVAADSGLATAHLGLGIARLRMRSVEAGREAIQTAVTLDPGNALLRSYLGKAYYEEKRSAEAGKELAAAKDLDPNDPTPWLYSAIRLQNENRPVEALDDLMRAVELNDNRAVYRSRLLLDEDRAVRGADLARIFNDLGFEDAGLVAARRSADENQANHSSHLLLAGNYRNLPGYAPAFLSEVLQARIYQPIGANAARPDVINASASFNEYTALFDRPRVRAFGGAAYGSTDTDLTPLGQIFEQWEIDDSTVKAAQAAVTSNGDRYAAALSYSAFSDDGFRQNADEDSDVYRGFVQVAASDRDTIQLNAIRGDRETGDLPLRQIVAFRREERFDTEETNVGVGWHRRLGPGSDLALSAIWNKTEQTAMDLDDSPRATAHLDGPQLEVQWVKRQGAATWIAGLGGFDGTVELATPDGDSVKADDTFWNGYAYAKLRGFGPVEVTAGAAVESVETPTGFIPPRDSRILSADLPFSETEVSPKVAVTATFGSGTTLRAAAFQRLAPFLGRLQTLEPTQVAGFNQFFEDVGGTRSRNYGVGVDQKWGGRWFVGASYLRRDLDIPEAYCESPGDFEGCALQVPTLIVERFSKDRWTTAYASGAPARWVVATISYDRQDRKFDTSTVSPLGEFEDRILTAKLRPEIRFFTPQGLFVRVKGTRYDQEVHYYDAIPPEQRSTRTEQHQFWVADAAVGYRFPDRWGSVVIDARNVLDKKFGFYERSVQERVIPARSVVARLEITY